MINCRQKGQRAERRAEEELRNSQWNVYHAKGSTKFNKETDIFGLWDILAIKKVKHNTSAKQLRKWVQVKTNKKPDPLWFHRAKIFNKKYLTEDDSAEVWIWHDRVGWEKLALKENSIQVLTYIDDKWRFVEKDLDEEDKNEMQKVQG